MSAIEPALTAQDWNDWATLEPDEILMLGGTLEIRRISGAVIWCPDDGAEEWARAIALPTTVVEDDDGLVARGPAIALEGSPLVCDMNRHSFAALLLHDQPYGFTHADADWLEDLATQSDMAGAEATALVVAKIRALLPPKP